MAIPPLNTATLPAWSLRAINFVSVTCSAALDKVISSVTPSKLLGFTSPAYIESLRHELSADFIDNDTYDIEPVEEMPESSEGPIYVSRSSTTGKCFVVKHTKRPATASQQAEYPNDAYIARTILQPHPNIIRVHACLPDPSAPGRHFIYTTHCEGGDLWDHVNFWWCHHHAPVPALFLLHAVVQTFEAFAYIHHGLRHSPAAAGHYTRDEHHRPVIHCDVKPENIFLRWSPRCVAGLPDLVLADFGHARLACRPDVDTGPGTPCWWAPEDKLLGDPLLAFSHPSSSSPCSAAAFNRLYYAVSRTRTHKSDIYALGQILYCLATDSGLGVADSDVVPLWPIGKSAGDLKISEEYDVRGLGEIVRRCLEPEVGRRAEASLEEGFVLDRLDHLDHLDGDDAGGHGAGGHGVGGGGVLHLVHGVRQVRDGMIRNSARLDPTDWFQAPRRPELFP